MPVPVTLTLADGLAVPVVGSHAFEVARYFVDETVTCTEKEISLVILRLIEQEKMHPVWRHFCQAEKSIDI